MSVNISPWADGHVYFAQAESGGPIKIGFTRAGVDRRLRQIKSPSGEPVVALASFEAIQLAESTLHDLLRRFRVRGEWFEDVPFVRETLNAFASAYGDTV